MPEVQRHGDGDRLIAAAGGKGKAMKRFHVGQRVIVLVTADGVSRATLNAPDVQAVHGAIDLADALEAAGVAPWVTVVNRHVHQAQYRDTKLMRGCADCGRDLGDPVHLRTGE